MTRFKDSFSDISMITETEIKQQVREFYNQVGWQEVSEGCYQNATYEDLRPVSHEYIHHCHMRVLEHLRHDGRYLLDAGSGPIQYPEYLEYSQNYHKRVCLDISSVALKEARKRIGEHGMYVIGDIAHLPFQEGIFDGLVSLHTIHHLPHQEHQQAFIELHRVLAEDSNGVIVNGWEDAPLMRAANLLVRFVEWSYARLSTKNAHSVPKETADGQGGLAEKDRAKQKAVGTHVQKHNAAWLMHRVGSQVPVEIYTWRSVSVRFLRTVIHERWGGRSLLQILFWFEEHFPHFFGRYGQYPLIVLKKPRDRNYG